MNGHARALFAWSDCAGFNALAAARLRRDAGLATLFDQAPASWLEEDRCAQGRVLAALGVADAASGAVAVVIGGQQPVLAGGPLMILATMASIAACSRPRRAELSDAGPPDGAARVLPCFWVAAEDHDFDELRRLRFPGALVELPPDQGPRHGAEFRRLDGAQAARLREDLRAALGAGFARVEDLVAAYLTGARESLARGFVACARALLGARAPLFLEPAQLRPHSAHFWRRCWQRRREYRAALEESVRLLRDAGFDAPITLREQRMPFYLLEQGVRTPVARLSDDRFLIGDRFSGIEPCEIDAQALGERLETRPQEVSPDALLRFLWQNALLPVAVTIGGPAEYAYWLQAAHAARVLEVPVPEARLRVSLSISDGRVSFEALRSAVWIMRYRIWRADADEEPRRAADLRFDDGWRESTRALAESMAGAPEIIARARARLARHQQSLRKRAADHDHRQARAALQGTVLDGDDLLERTLPLLWLLARHDRGALLAAIACAAESAEHGDHMLVELP